MGRRWAVVGFKMCPHIFFVTYHMGMSPNSSIFGHELGSNEENIAEVMLHDL